MPTVRIPAGTYHLGWRFELGPDAWAGIDSTVESFGHSRERYMAECFSPSRVVALHAFEIQTEPFTTIMDDVPIRDRRRMVDYASVCDIIDGVLAPRGWRLPTEDEFEAAAGGSLFLWGDEIPLGIPRRENLHRGRSPNGLTLPHHAHLKELVRAAFKMGDGGNLGCGGADWPAEWLLMSPSSRVPEDVVSDCWLEFLDDAWIHPVRL